MFYTNDVVVTNETNATSPTTSNAPKHRSAYNSCDIEWEGHEVRDYGRYISVDIGIAPGTSTRVSGELYTSRQRLQPHGSQPYLRPAHSINLTTVRDSGKTAPGHREFFNGRANIMTCSQLRHD